MRIRYLAVQTALIDQTDYNDNFIPGEWRNGIVMHDLGTNQRGNVATQAAQQERSYLKANCSSQIGEVQWQRNIIFRKYHLRDHVNSTAQPRDH